MVGDVSAPRSPLPIREGGDEWVHRIHDRGSGVQQRPRDRSIRKHCLFPCSTDKTPLLPHIQQGRPQPDNSPPPPDTLGNATKSPAHAGKRQQLEGPALLG